MATPALDPPVLGALLQRAVLGARTSTSTDSPVIGVLLELLSVSCGITGKQLLRLGHLKGNRWVRAAGFLLQNAAGPLLDAIALGFAAQSVLVLFGGLDAVGTLMVAPCLLGEKRTWRKIAGAVLVALGTITAAAVGPHGENNRDYGLDELPELFARPAVAAWALGFAVVAACCLREIVYGARNGAGAARGLAFGVLAGMFDGNSWCLKTVVRLLVVEHSPKIVLSPWFWMAALGALGSALSSMGLLIRGTALFSTVFLVPVLDGSRIVSGAASGLLVMDEANGLPVERLLGYILAVSVVLLGIQTLYSDEAAQLRSADPAASQELVSRSDPSVMLAESDGCAEAREIRPKRSARECCGCRRAISGKEAERGYCGHCVEEQPLEDAPETGASGESTGLFQANALSVSSGAGTTAVKACPAQTGSS